MYAFKAGSDLVSNLLELCELGKDVTTAADWKQIVVQCGAAANEISRLRAEVAKHEERRQAIAHLINTTE